VTTFAALALFGTVIFSVAFFAGFIVLFRQYLRLMNAQRAILTEMRTMLAGFFPKHIEDSLDKVPNDGQESFVHAPSTWDEEKSGRD
jgi:hypothetical protein